MSKLIRDIQLGDYTISVREDRQGNKQARLTSGEYGGVIDVKKLENDNLVIKELDFGSAEVSIENFALMLTQIGADQKLVEQINIIRGKK